jgi:hypothetical protein
MKRVSLFFLSVIVMMTIVSCSTPLKTTATWWDKQRLDSMRTKVKTIFIAVIAQNIEVKSTLENDLYQTAAAHGIKAIRSIDVYPPTLVRENLPSKDVLLKKIRDLGCDAIFTVALVDHKSETRYVSTTTAYAPYPYYGYYGTFGTYYDYSMNLYSSGYYTTDNTYYLESNLYNAKTEALIMSMQSKAENPSSIEKSSREYTQALLGELEKQGLLKKN